MRVRGWWLALGSLVLLSVSGCLDDNPGGGGGSSFVVVSTSPAFGSEAVDPLLVVEVLFSAPVGLETIDDASLVVEAGSGVVTGTLFVDVSTGGLRWTSDSPVSNLDLVTVTIAGSVGSATGVRLGTDYSFSFRTLPLGVYINHPTVGGIVDDVIGLEVLSVGSGITRAPTPVTFTIADPSIAVLDPAPVTANRPDITLLAAGETTLTVEAAGQTLEVPVRVGEAYGQPTTYLLTDSTWDNGTTMSVSKFDFHCTGGIEDGGHDEFDGAWEIMLDYNAAPTPYPCVAGSEISFEAPYVGLQSLRHETSGNLSGRTQGGSAGACHLRPTGDSLMYQDIALPAGAASLMLTSYEAVNLHSLNADAQFQIVVTDLTGGTGETVLYNVGPLSPILYGYTQRGPFDLLAYAGETIRLEFRMLGGGDTDTSAIYGAFVDTVSIVDQGATEYVVNGGCESDTTGWTAPVNAFARTVRYATQTLAGLDVDRVAYAPYVDGGWGRHIDTYTNNSGSAIVMDLEMRTNLGSDGDATGYAKYANQAWFALDDPGAGGSLAFLPGTFDSLDPDIVSSDFFYTYYTLNVPAGGSVSLLSYHLLGQENSGSFNPELETRAEDVINSIGLLGRYSPYARDIDTETWNTIVNWPSAPK